jgi:uncharacterized protein (TIGR00266 family)
MNVEIKYRPAFSIAFLHLSPDENVRVEAGAMVSMSSDTTLQTKAQGGLLKSLSRSVFGRESFFMNDYQASPNGGFVAVAPPLPGDMVVFTLEHPMLIQSGSYIASETSVDLDTKWGGAKTFFASEGLIMLRASGHGQLVLSAYGAIDEINLAAGQKITIDTGHLVAFNDNIGFKIKKVGGMKSTLFSGEGLVIELTGPGNVYTQTRSTDQFLSWLIPKLPKQNASSS